EAILYVRASPRSDAKKKLGFICCPARLLFREAARQVGHASVPPCLCGSLPSATASPSSDHGTIACRIAPPDPRGYHAPVCSEPSAAATLPRRARVTAFALLAVAAAVGFRFGYAGYRPLLPDEAYYWDWSRHLAAGYFD